MASNKRGPRSVSRDLEFARVNSDLSADLKRAEQIAAAARDNAENIVATVREPLLVLGPDLRVLSANRAFFDNFRVSKEETLGRPVFELGNRQWDIPRLRELLEEILPRETKIEDFLVDHEFESIGPRLMLLNARQVLDERQQAQHILLSIEDVTEREQAGALVRVQRDTLEMLIKGAPLPKVLSALALEMEKQSRRKIRAAIHMLDQKGTRFDLAAAPSLPDSYIITTQGLEIDSRMGPCCAAVLTGKSVTVADFDSDPQWSAFAEFARPLNIRAGWSTPIVSSRGAIVGTFATYYDEPREPHPQEIAVVDVLTRTVALAIERATAQADSARLASIVTSSEDAIISKDLSGIITSWNRGAEHLFGYTAEEAIGQGVTMLIPENHRDEEPEILRRIRRGDAISHYETVRRRKDGTLLDISLSVSPLYDGGKIIGASKVARDISEHKRAERALRKSAEDLDAANRSKSDFIAVLGHELRSPLNTIGGWIDVLKRPGLSEEDRLKGFETISRSVRTQAQLISDLLDSERIATGKMSLDLREVDLRTEVATALDASLPAARTKTIQLDDVECGKDPILVQGDSARLQQVFGNLLSNAIKFTPDGGRIRVACTQRNALAEVSVSDTGQGITERVLPYVFERFRQTEAVASRVHGGLGLGLSVTKQLVELHGGHISASSPGKGQGATFTVAFPLVSEAGRPALSEGGSPQEIVPASLSGLKVLVVDDEHEARELVRRVLEHAGAEVIAVRSAEEALQAVKQQRPDVLVSDIGMPGQDGYRLIRDVRALPPEGGGGTPAIALTAFATADDREMALQSGYSRHLAKPAGSTELVSAIASVAEGGASGAGARPGV